MSWTMARRARLYYGQLVQSIRSARSCLAPYLARRGGLGRNTLAYVNVLSSQSNGRTGQRAYYIKGFSRPFISYHYQLQ